MREVGARPVVTLLPIKVRGEVTLVLVADSEQTDVRLDGPKHAMIFDPSRGVGENETIMICYFVEIGALKSVRLDKRQIDSFTLTRGSYISSLAGESGTEAKLSDRILL